MKQVDTEFQIEVFTAGKDSNLYEYKMKLEKIKNELVKFGLTQNQSKVYVYLGKYGSKTAPEVVKSLGMPRTETYFILNTLQNKGIVTVEFSSPTRYTALPIEQAISTLINTEKENLDILARQEKEVSELWKEVPTFAVETTEIKQDRLQTMEGTGQIYSKLKEMIRTAREQIIIFGSEKDLSRFYHAEIVEMAFNSLIDARIIISPALRMPDFLNEFDNKKIRVIPDEQNNNQCFVIKDSDEIVLFLRNATHPSHNVFAMWSNSKSLNEPLRKLFEYSWESSQSCY
ncbi:MAG TPA: helix-turn-helix domain-containing protein [Candidatus Nitrosotalea sp.]|nr:helix-turn-helix domain-containing protein [Candidatus Nitrosotalea sp.]